MRYLPGRANRILPIHYTPGLRLEPITVAGRLTLPPNEIVRDFAAEYGDERARFEFVHYLEARAGEGRAVAGTVEAFLATPEKSKWEN